MGSDYLWYRWLRDSGFCVGCSRKKKGLVPAKPGKSLCESCGVKSRSARIRHYERKAPNATQTQK